MWRPRARFTVRGLMVAVLLIALACGGEICRRRRNRFQRLAGQHATVKAVLMDLIGLDEDLARSYSESGQDRMARAHRTAAATERRLAKHEDSLQEKYEKAARSPWLPIDPDPPEPK